jgi:hypothetical protein
MQIQILKRTTTKQKKHINIDPKRFEGGDGV